VDPVSVLKILWHHKVIAILVLLLTAGAGAAAFFLTPRVYEASASYAIVNPDVPTDDELRKDPALALLNSNNPFLRSSDHALIAQVMVTKLTSESVADMLEAQDLGTTYEVAPGGAFGPGLLIDIVAMGDSEKKAIETVTVLGNLLQQELYAVQKVNGADDLYLFSALQIDVPDRAVEQFSDRIRLLIVVVVAGFGLLFAAVSLARSIEQARRHRQDAQRASEGDRRRSPFASEDLTAWQNPPRVSVPTRASLSSSPTSSTQAVDGSSRPRRSSET
jgi:capsular polysaccharide biosynthesis protein